MTVSEARLVRMVRVRLAYGVVFATLVASYLVLPDLRPVLLATAGVAGAAGLVAGVRLQRHQNQDAWWLIGIAVIMSISGAILTPVVESSTGLVAYYLHVHDVVGIEVFLPLSVGLLRLARSESPARDAAVLLDTAVMSLAGSLLVWIILVRPAVIDLSLTGPAKIIVIASWVGYAATLAIALRVTLTRKGSLALYLLVTGTFALLVVDFFYGLAVLYRQSTSSVADLGFLAFVGLCGAAALVPPSRASAGYRPRGYLGLGRLFMLALALLVAPTALLVEATEGPVNTRVAIAVVSAVTALLLLTRAYLAVHAYLHRVSLERAVRDTLRDLVRATTVQHIQSTLDSSLARMLPAGAPARVRLVDDCPSSGEPPAVRPLDDPDDPDDADDADDAAARLTAPGSLAARRELGQLVVPVPVHDLTSTGQAGPIGGQGRGVVFVGPAAKLVEIAVALRVVAQQAGSALDRIDLVARHQAANREQYFRTLVLTSSDVTLISRDGRIEYATPSARTMFGRHVDGQRLQDLVTRDPPDRATQAGAGVGYQPAALPWTDNENGSTGYLRRPDGEVSTVLVNRRDLTSDPTVRGVVTTLRDVTAERRAQQELAYRASHDGLTGLVNAERFRADLRTAADRAGANTGPLWAVLFIDLDDFKAVNDTYGHHIGDGLLRTAAHRIRSNLRDGDVAARLGGDEFGALLQIPSPETARIATRRIADSLAKPAIVAGISVDCRSSIGVAFARTRTEHDLLLQRADTALYAAKEGGKGRWRLYHEGMLTPAPRNDRRNSWHVDRRGAILAAIREGALELHYQPVVELASGRTAGFEALVRPDHLVEKGFPPITPNELVQLAEDTGLIGALGEWVLTRALTDMRRLCPGGAARFVSVNVSAPQLHQAGFVDLVRRLLAGLHPSWLTLEITESLPMGWDDRTWTALGQLRRDGVRVAIDDYGTGCASLSYLRQPNVDIVKIDRTFVAGVDDRSRILLEAVVATTERLGLVQVAEGIDDARIHQLMLDVGCRYGQGFYYAAAMPVDEALRWGGGDPAVTG